MEDERLTFLNEENEDQDAHVIPRSAEEKIFEESSAALAGVVLMSPKQRYLRFDESLGKTFLHNRQVKYFIDMLILYIVMR